MKPIAELATPDLEAHLRITTHLAYIWGDLATRPGRYSSPSARCATARVRQHRKAIVEITSELDRRRGES